MAGPTPGYLAAEASAAPPARRGKTGLVLGVVVAMAAGGAGAFFLMSRAKSSAEPPAATPPSAPAPDPAPASAAAPDPAPAPTPPPAPPPVAAPAPTTVVLMVQGSPEGMEVVGPDGTLLGNAPGKITLPRSETPVRLEFRAKGHKAAGRRIVPDADVMVTVELEKKSGRKDRDRGGRGGKDDDKRPGKDDIEDAFRE
jgi:hypothetical protein